MLLGGVIKMNFDIKDVKSWTNRHDVKTLSVTGFFWKFFIRN